jgi:hypothetical protein
MREVIKFRNLKERDCATVAERCRATVRKDDVTSVTSRATIHNTAFSVCQNPALTEKTEGSAAPVKVE